MLTEPWDPTELSQFKLTALESQPRKDLLVQRNLGLPLNASHRCREFNVEQNNPPLDEEDLEFLKQVI